MSYNEGETKNKLLNLDELISGFSSMRIAEILKRASEISPSERSLGPAILSVAEAEHLHTNKENLPINNQQQLKDGKNAHTPSKFIRIPKLSNGATNLTNQKSPIEPTSPTLSIDYNLVRTTLIKKSSEKDRKDKLRRELEERQVKLASEIQQRKDLYAKTVQEQSDWMNEKLQNDMEIYEAGELYAAQETAKNYTQLRKLTNEKERKLREISFEAISKSQKKFKERYEKLSQLLLSIDKNAIHCEEHNNQLRDLIANFDSLIQKLKTLPITPTEVLMAESLCNRVSDIESNLITDINNKYLEQKRQQVEQQQKLQEQLEAEQKANQLAFQQEIQKEYDDAQNQTKDAIDIVRLEDFISKESLEIYQEIMKFYNEKSEFVKSLELDESWKKFRVGCKRSLNIPVSAISASSPQHLQDKFDKIYKFITGQNTKQSASDVNISDHPLAKDYCLLLLVKIFISQGQTEVSSNPQVAFPIASVIISLWNIIPEFGTLFLGQVFLDSPFLVPYFIPQMQGHSEIDWLRNLGYKVDQNGSVENHDDFIKRQTGIVRLYAAVMISTAGRCANVQKHPYSIENAWRLLCNLMNLKPLQDICATIIYELLQTTGHYLYIFYGQQFHKLIQCMLEKYMPILSKIDDKQPRKERLENYLQQIVQKLHIDKPKGILDPNYW